MAGALSRIFLAFHHTHGPSPRRHHGLMTKRFFFVLPSHSPAGFSDDDKLTCMRVDMHCSSLKAMHVSPLLMVRLGRQVAMLHVCTCVRWSAWTLLSCGRASDPALAPPGSGTWWALREQPLLTGTCTLSVELVPRRSRFRRLRSPSSSIVGLLYKVGTFRLSTNNQHKIIPLLFDTLKSQYAY